MSEKLWTAVDDYLAGLLIPPDPALDAAVAASNAAGLPEIAVTSLQGKLLYLLARMQRARNILEIGTLGGYSTIWLARALPPQGHLVTLEFDPKHCEIARANLERAGLAALVEQRQGPALETLPQIAAEGLEPFDFIFIDADKDNYPAYFEWALRLSRPGTAILADNVIRDGQIADPACSDPLVQGVQRFIKAVAAEPRVTATAIQTVASKGYDGFLLALVTN